MTYRMMSGLRATGMTPLCAMSCISSMAARSSSVVPAAFTASRAALGVLPLDLGDAAGGALAGAGAGAGVAAAARSESVTPEAGWGQGSVGLVLGTIMCSCFVWNCIIP